MHSGIRKTGQSLEQFCSQRSKYLREIGNYARRGDVKIGIENEGGDYEDYMQLLEAIDHSSVVQQLMLGIVLILTR